MKRIRIGVLRPRTKAILAAVLLVLALTVVLGCSVRIVVIGAPTDVDVKPTYVVTLQVQARQGATNARGVLAFRYPSFWDVASVKYSDPSNRTAVFSPNMAHYFETDWEAAHGDRNESITWNYVWWAGYTKTRDWTAGDTLTVTVMFNTHYKTANAFLDGYVLDFITGYSGPGDQELITDPAVKALWESGGLPDAQGVALDVRVKLNAFTDVQPTTPYYYAIEQIAHREVIDGYDHADGTREYRPNAFLNRAQFCKMVVKGLTRHLPEITEDLTSPFTDLGPDNPTDFYWHEYIARAYELGITTGTSATNFSPWLTLSRCQAVTMVWRAVAAYWAGDPEEPPAGYVSAWGKGFDPIHGPAAWRAEYWGLLDDIPLTGAASDPWAPIPRGEMAQLVWNAIVFITPPHYLH